MFMRTYMSNLSTLLFTAGTQTVLEGEITYGTLNVLFFEFGVCLTTEDIWDRVTPEYNLVR